jgi:acetyl-CoA carboxylase alpha subunit
MQDMYLTSMGEMRNASKVIIGNPEGRRSSRTVVFNLGYAYPRGYVKTSKGVRKI